MATLGAELSPPALEPRGTASVPSAASVSDFIHGTTLLYPVLGSPVAQVKARMLYALFARTGFDAAVVPVQIAPEDFPVALKALFRIKTCQAPSSPSAQDGNGRVSPAQPGGPQRSNDAEFWS